MGFYVTFDWASKAIMETVAIPFPSLEQSESSEKGKEDTAKVVADPTPPKLEMRQSSENQVTSHGNGRWNRDSSYRFNAGCNPHHDEAPKEGNVAIMSKDDAANLEEWFRKRFPDAKPDVLKKAGKWNLVLVRNGCVYNFHVTVE
jgi:hypothetical protein